MIKKAAVYFLFTNIIIIFCFEFAYSQQFEGKMSFDKFTTSDTVKTIYYIKGNLYRIDFLGKNDKIEKYKIINIETGDIKTVSPSKKLYKHEYFDKNLYKQSSNCEIIKTQNCKVVYGVKCNQWIVKNKTENSCITYWVVKKKYFQFADLGSIIYKTAKIPNYYFQIEGNSDFFPLEIVERSFLREFKVSIHIQEIVSMKLDDKLFVVPADYQVFE